MTEVLVLGGTRFVGPAFVDDARARGWSVTVFNRGTSAQPDGVEIRHGDRLEDGGLDALRDGSWDLVVDTWAGAPRAVRDAARLLSERADRYVYVSSRSVYAEPIPAGADESHPTVEASPDEGDVDYARAKRGGELAAQDAFGDRATFIRAGVILGPGENVGRLPWWLGRIARGGRVLAPGPADLAIQVVDVRDLAAFSLDLAERGVGGAFDVVCPPDHVTMADLLNACVEVTGSDAELAWTDPDTILAAGIEPWSQLPAWLPPGAGHDAYHRSDVSRALGAGLTCRPIHETVADTWAWLRTLPEDQRPARPGIGLPDELERRVLGS